MNTALNSSRKARILKTYYRLASSAKTDNEFRKLQKSLADRFCPLDWSYLHAHLAEKYNLERSFSGKIKQTFFSVIGKTGFSEKRDVEREFVMQYRNAHEAISKTGPAAFTRRTNTHGISHFVHPYNEQNRLLIIWTGAHRRPMMPLHTFLQAVWDFNLDVLVLRARPNLGYTTGVMGLGDTLTKAIDALCEFSTKRGYSNVYVIGMSMGTPPALFSSVKLGARNCLLAGPLDPRLGYNDEFNLFLDELRAQENILRVNAVVGELSPKDSAVADYLSSLLGSTKLVTLGAAHNPLWALARKGELVDWLNQHLLDGTGGLHRK